MYISEVESNHKIMKVVRRSIHSGIVRTKDLPITQEQIDEYERGVPIMICMPELNHKDKLFFISGVTDEDWDESTVSIGDKHDK